MKPEVRPKFVAFLEVGTELNLVRKKCTLRQNASRILHQVPKRARRGGETGACGTRRRKKMVVLSRFINNPLARDER